MSAGRFLPAPQPGGPTPVAALRRRLEFHLLHGPVRYALAVEPVLEEQVPGSSRVAFQLALKIRHALDKFHHAEQRATSHGHRWWEVDLTYLTIRALEAVGLVKDVVRPRVWTDEK